MTRIPDSIHNQEFHKLSFMKYDRRQEVHAAAGPAGPALIIFSTVKGSFTRRCLTPAWARTQAHLGYVGVWCHDVISAVRFQLFKQVSPGVGSSVSHRGGCQGCVMAI